MMSNDMKFDLHVEGLVKKTEKDQSESEIKVSINNFGKDDDSGFTFEEGASTTMAIAKGIIRSISMKLANDENDEENVNDIEKYIVSQLAMDVEIDPDLLRLATLKKIIGEL